MSDLSIHRIQSQGLTPLPTAKVEIAVRKAVMDDYPFIDALQKSCPGALGFQFESALIKRIEQVRLNVRIGILLNSQGGPRCPTSCNAAPTER